MGALSRLSVRVFYILLLVRVFHGYTVMDQEQTPLQNKVTVFYNSVKGDIENVSVLDRKLCQNVHFPDYHPPPKIQPELDPLIWQHWIENLTNLKNNLSWLLKLRYAKFWCQILNNTTIQSFLDSYLKHSPRFSVSTWPDDVSVVHDELHGLVFFTCIRMAANKESTTDFMSTDFFGELIYEKYLFDIPKLLDICVLYGNETNRQFLGKAIKNIFKCQPKYNEDLKTSVSTIIQIFHSIVEKCGLTDPDDDATDGSDMLHAMDLDELEDIVTYASDICFTLQRFLEVYPDACSVFFSHVEYFIRFYSTSLNQLRSAIKKKQFDDLNLRSHLLAHLRISRSAILSLTRLMLNECALQPALEASQNNDIEVAQRHASDYLNMLSEFMGVAIFFHDFVSKMSIADDLKSLIESGSAVDETRASFMLQSLGSGRKKNPARYQDVKVNGVTSDDKRETATRSKESTNAVEENKSSIDPEMASLVSMVRDVLPHLDPDYITSCLLHFDKDCERTIHALLEGSVPELTVAQQNSANVPIQNQSEQNSGPSNFSLLDTRRNVYDNDEFDINVNQNLDLSRIHKGKKNTAPLESEKPSQELKRKIYEQYSMVYDEEEITAGMGSVVIDDCNAYDDEYDDAYDGLGIDVNDAGDSYDILKRRPFVTPRVFLQGKKAESDDSSGQSGEDNERGSAAPRDHFIPNPAEVRAKNEARRQQQMQQRNAHRGNKPKSAPGQDKNTAQQRKSKDANKAKVANHSRKRMAAKKASRGMGP